MLDIAERQDSPWHEGERKLQRRAGVAEQMEPVGRRVMRTFLLDQHRSFYPLLPFVAIGSVDPEGDVWATLKTGYPGFLHSPDPLSLEVDSARDPDDPAERGLEDGDAIGLVGIDLITRRRNRLNGTVRRSGDESFSIEVGHSFGNCPRYIQNRHFAFTRDPAIQSGGRASISDGLGDEARRIIAAADTFFVASFIDDENGERQIDASHRGGRAGFVRIDGDGGLTVPDFNGNLFFNTLGNFIVNPKAGLLFVDHDSGSLLQMTGDVEVILDSPEIAAFEGAERLWRFMPRKVVFRQNALPIRWTFAENGFSPSSLMTGSWDQAAERLEAASLAGHWRPFRIERIVDESDGIRSFHLRPADGKALISHLAGQHLPIRIVIDGQPVKRSYTISTAPSDGCYRLSIKREGKVSSRMHELAVGDEIEALSPAGGFVIDAMERQRAAVLLAAGIGITPLLAMLRHIVHEGNRTRHRRPIYLFRSARKSAERAFDREIDALIEASEGSIRQVRVLSAPDAMDNGRYEVAGRIDMSLLKATLPFGDHDFYVCGPSGFMQSVYNGLRSLNISDARVHSESFGPSALTRDAGAAEAEVVQPAEEPVRVVFTQSAKEARWKPGGGSLLELAENRGLSPAFGCRSGSCGDCRTPILKGAVSYPNRPSYPVTGNEALLCSSVPAAGGDLHLAV